MHAASVHPEPGSNSRTNCISTPLGVETFISPSALALTLLFRVWSMLVKASTCFFLGIFEKFALALLVLISPVVQLSMINVRATLLRSLNSIPHQNHFVNRFSKSFFNFFQLFSKPDAWPHFAACPLYHYHPLLSSGFLKIICCFLLFVKYVAVFYVLYK